MKERLEKYRSFRLFMDLCVRCGACADKCHFYIGSGDPKNMPVLRAELLRSVYRRYFTASGKRFGRLAGARDLTIDVLKEWFYYFYQCTECRRCSVFCPYGIDQAEITMMGRELLNLVGCNINWVTEPMANCFRTGNHLGIQPGGVKDMLEFLADDVADRTGVQVEVPLNRKGAEILFVIPSGDYFRRPRDLYLHGLSDASPRDRAGLHLQHLRLRGGELRPVHLPRDDQAAQRQDLRGGEAPRGQMDPRGRVRPYVAGASTSTWTR